MMRAADWNDGLPAPFVFFAISQRRLLEAQRKSQLLSILDPVLPDT